MPKGSSEYRCHLGVSEPSGDSSIQPSRQGPNGAETRSPRPALADCRLVRKINAAVV